MRHHNPICTSYYSNRCGKTLNRPYQTQYINSYQKTQFKNATLKKRYVQVLQFIADHEGCKRVDINIALFGWKRCFDRERNNFKKVAYWSRGEHSNMYAQLLYLDLIDYDKKYRYFLTKTGMDVLKTAYVNENLIKHF